MIFHFNLKFKVLDLACNNFNKRNNHNDVKNSTKWCLAIKRKIILATFLNNLTNSLLTKTGIQITQQIVSFMTVMKAIMPFFKTVEELEYLINSVQLDFTLMVKVTLKM